MVAPRFEERFLSSIPLIAQYLDEFRGLGRFRAEREEPNAAQRADQAAHLVMSEPLTKHDNTKYRHDDQMAHARHGHALTEPLGQDLRVCQIREREDRKGKAKITQRTKVGVALEKVTARREPQARYQQAEP